ncbi:helix-turn-helix domain-containing protein [Allokutzneria albata]|uniref:DNA-binding transcriptional regulator YiaG, contains XRE-type HTH domain n=1 Tax=Allokutzneria albata TaxID=211114 RepID=A0A1H0CUC7_ALLAB|nr:helix-turn-helix transcriptional regulator [Allokutzneria albata]SDN61405.1 DNA-binding transcriptional regulator YiaG, contains XRE-type HTH domain [Allokutzneria albata]
MTLTAGRRNAIAEPDPQSELAELLRTGPFPAALRAAIQASGLSLDRVQYRLRAKGASVSVATLSNWQSGRRQPEGAASFSVLANLESVLGLPPSSLRALVGPPRPRGRYAPSTITAPAMEALWTAKDRLAALLSTVDTSSDALLTRLSQHDLVEVDASGAQRRVRVRQVLRADADGVDRWVVVYSPGHPQGAAAELVARRHCAPGRTSVDETGLMVAELLFEVPLVRGETIMMEYDLVNPPGMTGRSGDVFTRKFRRPVRDYLAEVQFDPAARPRRCTQISAPLDQPTQFRRRALTVSPAGAAHAVALDFGPGTFGIQWDL